MWALCARALLLMAGGGALGFMINAVRPEGVSVVAFARPSACEATSGPSPSVASVPAVAVLAPIEAAGLCGDPRTLLADVRPAPVFAEGHVTGAIHLPCAASGDIAAAAVALLAGKRTLVVYGDATEDAAAVADEMRRRVGRADLKVVVIEGGFAAWNRAGLACSSGPCLDCGVRRDGGGAK